MVEHLGRSGGESWKRRIKPKCRRLFRLRRSCFSARMRSRVEKSRRSTRSEWENSRAIRFQVLDGRFSWMSRGAKEGGRQIRAAGRLHACSANASLLQCWTTGGPLQLLLALLALLVGLRATGCQLECSRGGDFII